MYVGVWGTCENFRYNIPYSIVVPFKVLFNEAVNKVTAEKDKIIEELKRSEAALLAQTQKDRGIFT